MNLSFENDDLKKKLKINENTIEGESGPANIQRLRKEI